MGARSVLKIGSTDYQDLLPDSFYFATNSTNGHENVYPQLVKFVQFVAEKPDLVFVELCLG